MRFKGSGKFRVLGLKFNDFREVERFLGKRIRPGERTRATRSLLPRSADSIGGNHRGVCALEAVKGRFHGICVVKVKLTRQIVDKKVENVGGNAFSWNDTRVLLQGANLRRALKGGGTSVSGGLVGFQLLAFSFSLGTSAD